MKDKIYLKNEEARSLFGIYDQNIKTLEKELGVEVFGRGGELQIKGRKDKVEKAKRIIKGLISQKKVLTIEKKKFLKEEAIPVFGKREVVYPQTPGQKRYVEEIKKNDVVISIGPAGTGKTYLAVAMAISALREKEVSRVVLTRPAIEAGEKLGFLPGDLEEKIKPYLQPLYDALYDILEYMEIKHLFSHRIIEIVPLAYMRGRTLSDSFIILDEGQNSTPEQMKMFLTRLGKGSKAVVTGDITQSDLEKASGLIQIQTVLRKIKGIKFVYLTEEDVVRHSLVKEIIKAYEKNSLSSQSPKKGKD